MFWILLFGKALYRFTQTAIAVSKSLIIVIPSEARNLSSSISESAFSAFRFASKEQKSLGKSRNNRMPQLSAHKLWEGSPSLAKVQRTIPNREPRNFPGTEYLASNLAERKSGRAMTHQLKEQEWRRTK
jgi:hypothetical protein